VGKTAAKFAFYGVAIVLILWTASLTISFVGSALPLVHWIVPFFALVVFDGGMIAWLFVFIDYAQGSAQRVIAIAACILDLIGVGLMVVTEVFLGGQTLVQAPTNLGEYALWGIGGWTVANVAAVILFHLTDPEARKRMALQGEMDAVFEEALKKLKNKRAEQSGQLSDVLSDGLMAQLRAELATDKNQDGIPDAVQRGRPDVTVARSDNEHSTERPTPNGPVKRPGPLV
jgi:hypothetical protein